VKLKTNHLEKHNLSAAIALSSPPVITGKQKGCQLCFQLVSRTGSIKDCVNRVVESLLSRAKRTQSGQQRKGREFQYYEKESVRNT